MKSDKNPEQVIMITPEHIKELAKRPEPPRMEKLKNWVIILFSALSIVGFWIYYDNINQYRREIGEARVEFQLKVNALETKFETSMAYDSALKTKVAELQGLKPDQKIQVEEVVSAVKVAAREEMNKRKGTGF